MLIIGLSFENMSWRICSIIGTILCYEHGGWVVRILAFWAWDPGSNLTIVDLSGKVTSLCYWPAASLESPWKSHHGLTRTLWVELGRQNYLGAIDV